MSRDMWQGVFAAITTPFDTDGGVDHEFLAGHARRLVAAGSRGIVALGSLGEGATLDPDEKVEVLSTLVKAVSDRVPVVAGIAALSTDQAVELAQAAARVKCRGLMVLPPYVHKGDWPETRAHVSAVIRATPLSCMLYNNPAAYGVDFSPEQVRELADAGIRDMEEANRFLREVYLPDHNRRFTEPAAEGETAFVPVPGIELGDILCHQEERVVGNDNTVRFQGLVLQIPPSPWRPHFAKARVRVHRYHDGHLALFYGPRLIARFDREGHPIAHAHHRAA